MDFVKRYLSNPYIAAVLIGVVVFTIMNIAEPRYLQEWDMTPFAASMGASMIAVVFWLGYKWWNHDLVLPILGRRRYSFAAPLAQLGTL